MSGLDLFLWPLTALAAGTRPVISDGFKPVALPGSRQHLGVDLMYRRATNGVAAPPDFTKAFFCLTKGAQVVAAGPGRVATVDPADKHGIFVVIDHGTLAGVGPTSTAYRHLATIAVKVGDQVQAGAFLGFAGHDLAAGASSPNHLHFELWDRGRPRADGQGPRAAFAVDPEPAMRTWKVKTPSGFTSPDISPAGEDDAGETDRDEATDLSALVLSDLSVIHGGLL